MKKDKLHIEKDGFKVPENYFSEFENHLSERLASEAILPEKSGFKVPETYFDTLENSILSKVKTKDKSRVIKLSWFYNAAGIAAIFIIGFFISKFIPQQSDADLDGLAISEIDAYIEDGYFPLNTFEITDTFSDISLTDIDIASNLSEDDIFDYLDENMSTYGATITDDN